MAIETFLSWSGLHGDAATPANTGYAQTQNAGGSATFTNTWTPRNQNAIDANGTSTAGYVMSVHNITATDTLAYDQPLRPVTIPASEQAIFWFGTSADARQFSVVMMPDGSIMVRDGANANAYRSAANVFVSGVSTVVSVFFTRNATSGTFRVVVFNEDGTTIRSDSTLLTGKNTGSSSITRIRSTQAKSGSTSTVVARHLFGIPRWDRAATAILPAWTNHRPFRTWDGTSLIPVYPMTWDGTSLIPLTALP